MQGSNGADINAVRWGVWYVKRSAILVFVCNKEKEKRTKKEKEKHHQKKLRFVDCPEFLKERKKFPKKDRK